MNKDYWHSKEYQHDYYIKNKKKLQEYKRLQYLNNKDEGLYLAKNSKNAKQKGKRYTVVLDNEIAENFDKKLKEKDLKYSKFARDKILEFLN